MRACDGVVAEGVSDGNGVSVWDLGWMSEVEQLYRSGSPGINFTVKIVPCHGIIRHMLKKADYR